MKTRKEKIKMLKDYLRDPGSITAGLPKLDMVCCYPDLKSMFYYFINEKMVSGFAYMEARKRLKQQELIEGKQLGTGQIYIGPGVYPEHGLHSAFRTPDPLPDFFTQYLKDEKRK